MKTFFCASVMIWLAAAGGESVPGRVRRDMENLRAKSAFVRREAAVAQ